MCQKPADACHSPSDGAPLARRRSNVLPCSYARPRQPKPAAKLANDLNRRQARRIFMLGHDEALATIAVKDIKAARKFYETTLGLTLDGSGEGGALRFKSGNSKILVYQSQFAGTNQATAVTWVVGDVDGVVRGLKSKGVTFEHYDFPGVKRDG